MSYPWTFDDLTLVLDFYRRHGVPRKTNEQSFFELADLTLPHSAKSVRAQIGNFASLDPMKNGRFDHTSRNAEFVWKTFEDNPARLYREARKIVTNRRTWKSVQGMGA